MPQKYLITGGAGFIGSHLTERLLSEGHEIVTLDDLSTGSLENIARFRANERFRFFEGSVCEPGDVDPLLDGVDQIIHLAAAVGVMKIIESPVDTIERNVMGTEVLLKAAASKKVPVLLASTSEVYGRSREVPFDERQDLVLGTSTTFRWSYACSKLLDEFLGLAYHHELGSPVAVVRFFNTVGPRQSGQYGMVVPRFVSAALAGEPIPVYGTGDQTRCFCHVSDCIEAILLLMRSEVAYGSVFNVGNPEEVSINELARRVIERTGSTSKIERIPYEKAYSHGFEDMMRRVPSIDKIQETLGFSPSRRLDDIIDDVAADLRGSQAALQAKTG